MRLSAFLYTGLSAFAPIFHAMKLFDLRQLNQQSGLPYYYAEGVILLCGALLYGAHIPERFYPGYFDMWMHSHFLFHSLVVLASAVHFYAVWTAFEWNYTVGRCTRRGT